MEQQPKRKRERASERRERLQLEQAQRHAQEWAEFRSKWLLNLLNLVYEYSVNPELVVIRKEDAFEFDQLEKPFYSVKRLPVNLPDQPDFELMRQADDVDMALKNVLLEQRLAEEQWRKRQSALNKLSAEERELLNLN